ncbi:MAG: glycerate kinase type-2 family protein [Bosea sp. (in: a-proteobacteria)]
MENSQTRAVLQGIFRAAVMAAHPAHFLPAALPAPPVDGRLIILAAGKAAGSMVQAAENHYLNEYALPARAITGHAVARIGYGAPTRVIPLIEAGHPVPDTASIEAGAEALALAQSATDKDLVLVLLSGGASANWIAPAGQLTLDEKRAVTRALLRSGAPISEMNVVRKHLSRIKGGRLALAAQPAKLVTLAISDVPGDEPSAIGSGPTVPDASTLADARAIVARYGLRLPQAAMDLLADPAMETPKAGHPAFEKAEFHILARPLDAMNAAARAAEAAGYRAVMLGADIEGEAHEVAAAHARLALEAAASGTRAAIISGGELTVTLRGKGKGGPNQEYALALALALNSHPGIAALAGDTDGTDGGGGLATDPAGALVFPDTLARAMAAGLDARALLADNDSTCFFDRLNDLLTPGPTLTNVNDCRVILVEPSDT